MTNTRQYHSIHLIFEHSSLTFSKTIVRRNIIVRIIEIITTCHIDVKQNDKVFYNMLAKKIFFFSMDSIHLTFTRQQYTNEISNLPFGSNGNGVEDS